MDALFELGLVEDLASTKGKLLQKEVHVHILSEWLHLHCGYLSHTSR